MKKWQYLVLILVTTGFILRSDVLSLFSTPATSGIATHRASSPPAIPVSDSARSLRFVAVGDLMLGTNYPSLSSLPKDASVLLQPAETLIKMRMLPLEISKVVY
jgi:hypothetical protein